MTSISVASQISEVLDRHGFESYLIGGAVRDMLLGREPKDFDLVTNATPQHLASLKEFESVKPVHPAQAFGVSIVKIRDNVTNELAAIEVTTYRRDVEAYLGRKLTKVEFAHLEDDLQRRDFTVNALAFDALNNYLVDEVRGLPDIDAKLIRFIGEPKLRIQEDPLRILRGIRLAHQLQFKLELNTERAIMQAISDGVLAEIAIDRVRSELNQMLELKHRYEVLVDLHRLGVLDRLLPELTAGIGVAQPQHLHAEGDVFTHSILASSFLPARASLRLVWATLLHDIGKVPTQSMPTKSTDRIRFNDHYKVGAKMATGILKRFKFANKFIADVAWMIDMHLGIDDLPSMTKTHQHTMMSQPAFCDLLLLHQADARASWQSRGGSTYIPDPKFEQLHKMYNEFKIKQKKPQKTLKDIGVDGNWLKKEFGYKNGPELGRVLEKLNKDFLEGKIETKTDAKKLL